MFHFVTLLFLLSASLVLNPACAEIKMVADFQGNTPTNPTSCLTICSGSTGWGNTAWIGGTGWIRTEIDISQCEFVDTPIVTTAITGNAAQSHTVGATSVHSLKKDGFKIYVFGPAWTGFKNTGWSRRWTLTPNQANRYNYSIMWYAMGFVCQ